MVERAFRLLLHHPAVRALVAACDDVGGGTGPLACHLVGGVLRDRALGLPVHDIDAVVPARGREVAERLAVTLPARLVALGGKEFAAFRLVVLEGGAEMEVDLWDRAGMSFADDLARRDFTVNSFAVDARSGAVTDPFDGLGDLRRRILRATTPASFTGDPLRVLRLPRLLLRLPGFAADPGTVVLARRAASLLPEVAAERVRDELAALFAHPEAHRGLALLIALDLYPGLWLGRPGEPGPSGTALSELEALPERIRDLRQIGTDLADAIDTDSARAARLAALFANLPGGAVPLTHLERFRDAGYLTRGTASAVALLLSLPAPPADEPAGRRWLHRAGPLWPTAACGHGARIAARSGDLPGWQEAVRRLADLARREGDTLFDPPRLLTGGEVQELLGIPPGREVGRVLDAVRGAQVDGTVRTRDEAVEMVRSLGALKPTGRSPSSPSPARRRSSGAG
jgi:tRNA nucleotidyltransferase/poly(A) polymerase